MLHILRLSAGWLEKFSVGAMAVGVFQENIIGVALALACYGGSAWLTLWAERITRMAGEI